MLVETQNLASLLFVYQYFTPIKSMSYHTT